MGEKEEKTITITLEEAQFIQQMTLDLKATLFDLNKRVAIHEIGMAILRLEDKLEKFYNEIEKRVFAAKC